MPTEVVPPPPAPASAPKPRRSNFLLVLVLLVVAFAAGYVPAWWEARTVRGQLETTQLQLRLVQLHDLAGAASQEAQRSNYANAAASARTFFDQCATLANSGLLAKEPRTQTALLGYAAQRDEVMALLAAADPAARERLAGIYFAMQGVLGRRP